VTLNSGSRLGPYEILSSLGSGGMGEGYKARDTRLERLVAIKVLGGVLAADQQFHERFEREARTISQLNHPNICTLHDVGKEESVRSWSSTGSRSSRRGRSNRENVAQDFSEWRRTLDRFRQQWSARL